MFAAEFYNPAKFAYGHICHKDTAGIPLGFEIAGSLCQIVVRSTCAEFSITINIDPTTNGGELYTSKYYSPRLRHASLDYIQPGFLPSIEHPQNSESPVFFLPVCIYMYMYPLTVPTRAGLSQYENASHCVQLL